MNEKGETFRGMRRSGQQLSAQETIGILERNEVATLALAGDGGYPYAVPVNYSYADGRIYFHSATSGHKADAIAREPRASLCVIDQAVVVPERYTSEYRSAIVFGEITAIADEKRRREAITMFTRRFCDSPAEEIEKEIDSYWNVLAVYELRISHMSGKRGGLE